MADGVKRDGRLLCLVIGIDVDINMIRRWRRSVPSEIVSDLAKLGMSIGPTPIATREASRAVAPKRSLNSISKPISATERPLGG